MLTLYTESMAKAGIINTGRVTQLQTLFHQQYRETEVIYIKSMSLDNSAVVY